MLSRFNLVNQVYFVTSKTNGNILIFKDDLTSELFIKTLKFCREKYRFKLYGYVVIPDHIHLLIKPAGEFTISQVIQKIKSIFAKKFKEQLKSRVAASLARSDSKTVAYANLAEYGISIWQKSFYDHAIRNEKDFLEKLNYIHKNPLKHGVVTDLNNYPWSSYQNYYLNNNLKIDIDIINL